MNLHSRLRGKVVNHQLVVGFIVVVQTWFILLKNKVGFEADHIMQETSKLVHFAAHDNIWSRVFFKVALVKSNLALECLTLL